MKAIVYTSDTGFTARYAKMLSEKTGLCAYELAEAERQVEKGSEVIYLGWLFASTVKGYRKAAKRYKIAAVCGVGLCETGCLLAEVRKAISLPDSIPLFTVQGGMDHAKLHGINKLMIKMLLKILSAKKNGTEDDARMLALIRQGGDYVCEENLAALIAWYESTV